MITNKYWVFKSAISKEKCEEIIELGSKNLENATVGGEAEKHNNPDKVPSNTLTKQEIKEDEDMRKMFKEHTKSVRKLSRRDPKWTPNGLKMEPKLIR